MSSIPDLSGKRVLVTGGTGFIGGRLVERLILDHHARVRVLFRDYRKIGRVARFPVELVQGDLVDPQAVDGAMQEIDFVFHCAYGNQGDSQQRRSVNVDGTRNIVQAATRAKVKRLIYLSTIMVYGITPDGDCDETSPKRHTGNIYGDSKIEAEDLIRTQGGVPVVTLQPTAVYGPYAPVWTVNVLQQLKEKRRILVNGGNGLCNAVYVDDLIDVMLQAAVHPAAVGESFIISGEKPVSWKEFFASFEAMLGTSATLSMSAEEAQAFYRQHRNQRKPKPMVVQGVKYFRDHPDLREALASSREIVLLKRLVRSVTPRETQRKIKDYLKRDLGKTSPKVPMLPVKEIDPLSPFAVQFFATKTTMRIDKAQAILGYRPRYTLEDGMRLTERWARWSKTI